MLWGDDIQKMRWGHTKSTKSRHCDISMKLKNILKRWKCGGCMIKGTEKIFEALDTFVEEILN